MGIAYNSKVVTDNLVLYIDAANIKSYPGNGSSLFDLTSNSTTGTLISGYLFSNGNVTFSDGRCDHSANLAAVNAIANTSSFTFSTTLRINTFPPVQTETITGVLMKGSYNPSYGINLAYSGDSGGLRTTAQVYYGIRNISQPVGTPGRGQFALNSFSTLALGSWYKIDMVHEFSVATHTLRLYINGELDRQDSTTDPALYPIAFQNTSSVIGINSQILGGNFINSNISVASYSIYTKALSADEIRQNFVALRGRFSI